MNNMDPGVAKFFQELDDAGASNVWMLKELYYLIKMKNPEFSEEEVVMELIKCIDEICDTPED
mgnify:CR=1 FL=1